MNTPQIQRHPLSLHVEVILKWEVIFTLPVIFTQKPLGVIYNFNLISYNLFFNLLLRKYFFLITIPEF